MALTRPQDAQRLKDIYSRPVKLTEEQLAGLVRVWSDTFKTPDGQYDLHPHQAFALETAKALGGGLFPMTVGAGKGLLALLLPAAMGIEASKTVVLVPPALVAEGIRQRDILSEDFKVPHDIRFVSYSTLSTAKGLGLLESLKPDLIIADEAQCLKDKKSNRTSRFLKYMRSNPDTKFVAMSATFSSKTIQDFAHLSALALGGQSPLPLTWNLLQSFSRVFDPTNEEQPEHQDYYYAKIALGKEEPTTTDLGIAITSSLGVVATEADSCDMPLSISRVPSIQGFPKTITSDITRLAKTHILPCGQFVDSPALVADKCRQMSLGFYYREIGDIPREYKTVRSKVFMAVRAHSRMDEAEVLDGFRRGTLACSEPEAWKLWVERWEDFPKPQTEAVWMTDVVLEWAHEQGGLIWYRHKAVRERARELGFEAPDPGVPPTSETAFVSAQGHGTGLNLQAWNKNVILYAGKSGALWQQMLGRTHRNGQKNPVDVQVLTHTNSLKWAFDGAIKSSEFIKESQNLGQKLLTAQIR